MAFYFALLNVSKKDNQERNSHHRRHRRHSIASVESPLLDYRLLPRPQLLSDDVVITNELAHHVDDPHHNPPTSSSSSQAPLSRRCRGSARASKWVNDNHSNQLTIPPPPPQPIPPAPPLSRSKRMAFGERGREGNVREEEERRGRRRKGGQSEEDELMDPRSGQGGSGRGQARRMKESKSQDDAQQPRVSSEGRKPKMNHHRRQKSQSHSEDDLEACGRKKEEEERKGRGMKRGGKGRKEEEKEEEEKRKKEDGGGGEKGFKRGPGAGKRVDGKKDAKPTHSTGSVQGTSSSRIPVSTTPTSKTIQSAIQSSFPLTMSMSSTSSRHLSPPVVATSSSTAAVPNGNRKPIFRSGNEDRPIALNPSIFQMMAGSATDESGRSSSQMSNESTTPRRDDSPASSCDSKEREVTMKLSAISMSSRSSEPRLKKVTFESSPYVISNSFLGDGAGSGVLVVRRNSGTAVRRMAWTAAQTRVLLAPHAEVSGGDWWTRCEEEGEHEEQQEEDTQHQSDNRTNRQIEKSQAGTRSILRRGLIRRRSTSDKSRLLAYRNTGFLSSSQERKSESTSASRMTVSVDRPKYK